MREVNQRKDWSLYPLQKGLELKLPEDGQAEEKQGLESNPAGALVLQTPVLEKLTPGVHADTALGPALLLDAAPEVQPGLVPHGAAGSDVSPQHPGPPGEDS